MIDVLFTIVYFFSAITAFAIVIGLICFMVWKVVNFIKQRTSQKQREPKSLEELQESLTDIIEYSHTLKDMIQTKISDTQERDEPEQSTKIDKEQPNEVVDTKRSLSQ